MRLTLRRAALLALPVAAAGLAACFEDSIPTKQIGGTEYGLPLLAVSPLARTPIATFTARRSGTGNVTLDSLVVTLANLKPLAGPAVYRFYAVGNAAAGDTVPVQARLFLIHRDSTVDNTGAVTVRRDSSDLGTSDSFEGLGSADSLYARFGGAQFAGGNKRFLVVTIQPNAASPAFTAATPRPLWVLYRDTTVTGGAVVNGAVRLSGSSATATQGGFGTFEIGVPPYRFPGGGRGRSAFWDRYGDGRMLYSAVAENLAQPPLGYYYQPWMRDTVRGDVRFGELTANVGGASLFDYDQRPIGTEVAQLPTARFGTSEQEIGQPLQVFAGVHLVLEPKLGDDSTLALTTVLLGTVGDTVRFGRGSAVLRLLALRGTDSIPDVVIVAYAPGSAVPIATATTAGATPQPRLKGQATMARVPAGTVDLYVTPPGGSTTTRRIEVVARDTMQVTLTLP